MNPPSGRATPTRPRARAHTHKKNPTNPYLRHDVPLAHGDHRHRHAQPILREHLRHPSLGPERADARVETRARRRTRPPTRRPLGILGRRRHRQRRRRKRGRAHRQRREHRARVPPRAMTSRRRRAGRRADADDDDGYIDRYKKYLYIRLYTVRYSTVSYQCRPPCTRGRDGRWTRRHRCLCPSHDES